MKNKSLDDRMKEYEFASDIKLTNRLPMILRVDGRAFHTYLRKAIKPFDSAVIDQMTATTIKLCEEIPGAIFGYTQSDEISIYVRDDMSLNSEPWFNKRIQKICSIAASIATVTFNGNPPMKYGATFDARVFVLPENEVNNYFLWRQQDCTKNSIQMVAQSLFSHKELQNKNCNQLQEMMFQQRGINYNDLATHLKRGTGVVRRSYMKETPHGTFEAKRWEADLNIPVFSQDTNYINNQWLNRKAEYDRPAEENK